VTRPHGTRPFHPQIVDCDRLPIGRVDGAELRARTTADLSEGAGKSAPGYLGDDADALDGFEFLTMAEAGEVGHWSVLRTLNQQAGDQRLQGLIDWALPIQERHFNVKAGSLKLASEQDPSEPA
jgi:hypothetical protein